MQDHQTFLPGDEAALERYQKMDFLDRFGVHFMGEVHWIYTKGMAYIFTATSILAILIADLYSGFWQCFAGGVVIGFCVVKAIFKGLDLSDRFAEEEQARRIGWMLATPVRRASARDLFRAGEKADGRGDDISVAAPSADSNEDPRYWRKY